MTVKIEECKGCRTGSIDPGEAIARFLGRLEQSDVPLVSSKAYQQRLDTCRKCESLQGGHSCGRCGCFVEVRAKLAESDCPYPFESKWR